MALDHFHVIERPAGKLHGQTKILGTYGSRFGRPGYGAQQSAGRIAKIYAERFNDEHPNRIGPGYFMVGLRDRTVVIQWKACFGGDVCREAEGAS